MAGVKAHYSAHDIKARILAAIRAAGLNPEQRLSPDALAGNARRSLQEARSGLSGVSSG
jgi:hypothetical protein